MPKIQLALDTLDFDHALHLASLAAPFVDIIEAGTPLIKSVGISIVTRLKAAHPDKIILADLKSSDVGAYEAEMAFKAGADIVTTQGITTLATITEVQREADVWHRRAEVDMTGVSDPLKRAREVQKVGVGRCRHCEYAPQHEGCRPVHGRRRAAGGAGCRQCPGKNCL